MALLTGFPKAPYPPSGRYTRTNPLRREFGLRLLTEPLPEPLRGILITAWRRPMRFYGQEAIQSLHRQRADEAQLYRLSPRTLGWLAQTELEVSRRVVEAPMGYISRETRNTLLATEGVYLQQIYSALASQIGEEAALATFQQAVEMTR